MPSFNTDTIMISNTSDHNSPTQHRRLSIRMKPPAKMKSPEMVTVSSHQLPLLKQLTSTLTKAASPAIVSSNTGVRRSQRNAVYRPQSGNISGISPIKESSQHPPVILVSSFSTKDTGEKTVTRPKFKVKSPTTVVRGIGEIARNRNKETIRGQEKESLPAKKKTGAGRSRIEELQLQVKDKDSEIVSMKRKINSLQKSLTEKDKALKDLEIKVPKMLADLKKNLLEDESKKKANRDLKESIKRNRNLSGTMKQVEDQLKIKENKLKDAIEEKKKIDLKLILKEKECKEHSHLISQLECKLLELKRKFASGELEIEREKKRRNILEVRYRELCTEDQIKYELIEKMKTEVFHLGNVSVSREKEIELLNRQNFELQTVIQNQEDKMDQMMKEISEYRNKIERFSIGGCKEVVSVSDEHRDRNTSLDLMVTLKTRRSSSLIGVVNVGDTSASFTASIQTEIIDDVFLDFMEDEESCMKEGNSMSTTGCSEYSRPSSGTYRRLEELDVKVQGLWTKLQAEDNRCSDLQNKKTHFNDSVVRLERDLDESVIQHSELVTKVGVVKRLFE